MADCVEAVLKYLTAQNRPYSAGDVAQNMHKEFGKTAVQKALEQLAAQGRILEKVYGKQKVYCARQDGAGAEDASKDAMARVIADLDAQIVVATEKVRNLERLVSDSETLLRDLESTPTTETAAAELAVMEDRLSRLRSRLVDLADNCVQISPEEMGTVRTEHEKSLKEYRKRKRICNDIVNSILEGYPKPKKTLLEEVGVETDEDVGVSLR